MRATRVVVTILTSLGCGHTALAAPGAPPAGYQFTNVSSGIGSTSVSHISQMTFKSGDPTHLYVTRLDAGVTRYDYNAASGQLSNPFSVINLAGVADGMDSVTGIGFHGNDLWISRFSGSSRAAALSRFRDIIVDGVYENRSDFVTGMTTGMHEINQIQIFGNSLFTSVGTKTNTGNPASEDIYNGTVDRIGDLTNATTVNLSTAGDRTAFQQTGISDGRFRRFAGGMRNPFGIRVTSAGAVWVADNGQDPVNGATTSPDWLYRNLQPGDVGHFPAAGYPGEPTTYVAPLANLGDRVGAAGFDFVPTGPNRGDALVVLSSTTSGQRLALINSSGAVSSFMTGFNLPTDAIVDPYGRFLVSDYLANSIYLLTPPRDADSNLDGQVDITDLYALASHWHASASWSNGDFDRNGLVDAADLGLLAKNWQGGVAALSVALTSLGLPLDSVPEPGPPVALLGLGAAASWRRTQSTRRTRSAPGRIG